MPRLAKILWGSGRGTQRLLRPPPESAPHRPRGPSITVAPRRAEGGTYIDYNDHARLRKARLHRVLAPSANAPGRAKSLRTTLRLLDLGEERRRRGGMLEHIPSLVTFFARSSRLEGLSAVSCAGAAGWRRRRGLDATGLPHAAWSIVVHGHGPPSGPRGAK